MGLGALMGLLSLLRPNDDCAEPSEKAGGILLEASRALPHGWLFDSKVALDVHDAKGRSFQSMRIGVGVVPRRRPDELAGELTEIESLAVRAGPLLKVLRRARVGMLWPIRELEGHGAVTAEAPYVEDRRRLRHGRALYHSS